MPGPAGPIGPRSHMPGGGGAAPSFRASLRWAVSAGSGRDRSMSTLKVYSTSVTGSREIKSQQSEVTRILDGKNIKYELVDISQDNALREEMRAKAGNPKAIPPQIVNGDHYCGDYELFVEAVEQNTLQEFLKLA
ncbi:SH3 domain-binding glutamic acid-rich-like protein 3 [Chlamydotis macqueenii]